MCVFKVLVLTLNGAWKEHDWCLISFIYVQYIKRANRTVGLLFEVTKGFNDPVCVKTLYCALARPIPENCLIVWCASAEVWKKIMERMHRKFTSFAIWLLQLSNSSTSLYQSRRLLLGLETLADRIRNTQATVNCWSTLWKEWLSGNIGTN